MTQVERRILTLEFDNHRFELGIRSTMETLDQFERKLEMRDATNGFDNIERKANDISFRNLQQGVEDVADKFTSMEMTAVDSLETVDETAGKSTGLKGMLESIGQVVDKYAEMGITGLQQITAIVQAFASMRMDSAATAVDNLSQRFTNLGIVGMAVLNRLTNSAIDLGTSLVSKVINPIVEGGKRRAMAIENARFMLQGLVRDETEVNAIMQNAQDSVTDTAYAYNDAASAAAQFAATGLRSGKEMETALKAIAGTAATTNANYSDIAHIFTTVAGNGRLMGEQLNQFSYRGLNAAATLRDAFNEVLDGSSNLSAEMQQHIRDLVEYGDQSISNFTGSLKGVTEGDIRELVSKGVVDFQTFATIMGETFGDHAKDANKTFTGSMANIQAALARTGAMFYSGLIVQEGPLVKFFNSIRVAINAFNKQLQPVADLWTEVVSSLANGAAEIVTAFSGTEDAVKASEFGDGILALRNIINGSLAVFRAFGRAVSEVFGMDEWNLAETVQSLTKSFKEWTESLIPTEKQVAILERNFSGLLSLFKIAGTVIGGVAKVIGTLLNALAPIGWKLLEITAVVGDLITAFADALTSSSKFEAIITGIGNAISWILGVIDNFAGVITGAVSSFGEFVDGLGIFKKKSDESFVSFDKFASAMDKIAHPIDFAKSKLEGLSNAFKSFVDKAKEIIGPIGTKLSEFFSGLTFERGISLANTGIFAAFVGSLVAIWHNLQELLDLRKGATEGIHRLGESFKELVSALREGQDNLDAGQLLKLAAAIGILAISLTLISQLDIDDLVKGAAGIAGLFGILGAAMKWMLAFSEDLKDVAAMRQLATIMIMLAVAIGIMGIALSKIGQMDAEEIAQGLIGIGGAMAILVAGAKSLDQASGNLKKVAGKMILLAIALNLMVLPIKTLSGLSLQELGTGILGLSAAVVSLAVLANALDKVKVKPRTAVAMIALAAAVSILADAVIKFKDISVESMVQGLVAVGLLLAGIGVYANFVKPDKLLGASVAMLIISGAISVLADVVERMAELRWQDVVKGLVLIGSSLMMFAAFTELVKPDKLLRVSVSLAVMSGAMTILAGVVERFAELRWQDVVKGVGAIGVLLLSFSAAAEWTNKAVGGALALSVMMLAIVPLLNVVLALANMPLENIAVGLGALAGTFVIFGVAAKVLAPFIPQMIGLSVAFTLLGVACLAAGVGIGAAATGLAALAGAVGAAGGAILGVVQGLLALLPYAFEQLGAALVKFIKGIADSSTELLDGIVTIGTTLLEAFNELIPKAAEVVMEFVKTILETLVENTPTIVESSIQLITGIVQGIADNIDMLVEAGLNVVSGFLDGVAEGLPGVIDSAFNVVVSFINGLAEAIRNNHQPLYDAVWNLLSAFGEAIMDFVGTARDKAGELIGGFFEGILGFDPIGKITEIGGNIGQGFIDGINSMATAAADAITSLFQPLIDVAGNVLGVASPSTVFFEIGSYTAQGWIDGFNSLAEDAATVVTGFFDSIIDIFTGNDDTARATGAQTATSMITGLASKTKDYAKTGQTQASSYSKGLGSQSGSVSRTAASLSKGAVSSISSYAGSFTSNGSTAGGNYASGINSKTGSASSAGASVGRSGRSGAGGISWYGTGQDAANGYKQGINSMISAVSRAAASLASSAKAAAARAQESNSPSKVFMRLGTYAGQGYELGMLNHISAVSKASASMASSAIQVANDILSDIDFDADIDPVITPVVDLSGVNEAKRTIEGIFSNTDIFYGLENSVQGIGYSAKLHQPAALTDIYGNLQQPSNETVLNVNLNYDAGADANQMARDVARMLKRYRLTEGV